MVSLWRSPVTSWAIVFVICSIGRLAPERDNNLELCAFDKLRGPTIFTRIYLACCAATSAIKGFSSSEIACHQYYSLLHFISSVSWWLVVAVKRWGYLVLNEINRKKYHMNLLIFLCRINSSALDIFLMTTNNEHQFNVATIFLRKSNRTFSWNSEAFQMPGFVVKAYWWHIQKPHFPGLKIWYEHWFSRNIREEHTRGSLAVMRASCDLLLHPFLFHHPQFSLNILTAYLLFWGWLPPPIQSFYPGFSHGETFSLEFWGRFNARIMGFAMEKNYLLEFCCSSPANSSVFLFLIAELQLNGIGIKDRIPI